SRRSLARHGTARVEEATLAYSTETAFGFAIHLDHFDFAQGCGSIVSAPEKCAQRVLQLVARAQRRLPTFDQFERLRQDAAYVAQSRASTVGPTWGSSPAAFC